jgi:hypothetical protein
MYQKGSRFYSDWLNRDGKRRRKAHLTALAATRHEAAMKREADSHPHGGPRQRTSSSSPSSRMRKQTLAATAVTRAR